MEAETQRVNYDVFIINANAGHTDENWEKVSALVDAINPTGLPRGKSAHNLE
jgi:hypothetical protein